MNNVQPAGRFPYGYQLALTIPAGAVTVDQTFTFPNYPLFIEHIRATVYDNNGAILAAEQNRDLFLFNMSDGNAAEGFFNEAIDVFMLDEMSRSNAFRGFIIDGKTQYTASLTISSFVNGGTPLATRPVRALVLLQGYKLTGQRSL